MEIKRRNLLRPKVEKLRASDFYKQIEYLEARKSHRYRAVQCTRRAGKTEGDIIDDIEIAQQYPGSKLVRLALTLDSCLEIGWDTFLEKLDIAKIKHKSNIARSFITLDNGSKIRFSGVDSNEKEMKKILGQKLRKVSIDECGSMTIKMGKLVYQMIDPALTDLAPNTWISLLGTPENIPNTFFESVTSGQEKFLPWHVIKWTTYENPFMRDQWIIKVNEMIKNNPEVVNASWYKTHYLNEWCSDDNLLILPITQHNFAKELPLKNPNYTLGVDLGYNDANAFSLVAWDYDSPNAYLTKCYKQSGMDFTETANMIKEFQSTHNVVRVVIDGANKQGVQEMRNRHGLSLEIAEKQDKHTFLKLLKDDFMQKRLFIVEGEDTEPFVDECKHLQWKDELKIKEDPRCENHGVDSTLYAWRESRHYYYQEPEPKFHRDSNEYMDQHERELAEKLKQGAQEWMNGLQDSFSF